jgi:hypothetical protein
MAQLCVLHKCCPDSAKVANTSQTAWSWLLSSNPELQSEFVHRNHPRDLKKNQNEENEFNQNAEMRIKTLTFSAFGAFHALQRLSTISSLMQVIAYKIAFNYSREKKTTSRQTNLECRHTALHHQRLSRTADSQYSVNFQEWAQPE